MVVLGGVQQLRRKNFAIFWPPPPPSCVVSFYTLHVDKNRAFFNPSPSHLVHVVIEWPLTEMTKKSHYVLWFLTTPSTFGSFFTTTYLSANLANLANFFPPPPPPPLEYAEVLNGWSLSSVPAELKTILINLYYT